MDNLFDPRLMSTAQSHILNGGNPRNGPKKVEIRASWWIEERSLDPRRRRRRMQNGEDSVHGRTGESSRDHMRCDRGTYYTEELLENFRSPVS